MRIVLDTNIYIAAAISDNGFSEYILKQIAKAQTLEAIVSEAILAEIQSKLRDKFNWLQEDTDRFINRIKKFAESVEVTENIEVITRDPEDNKILECAISGNADLVVSLDQDLIKLKTYKGIGIIHPKTLSWTFPEYFKKN